MSLLDDIDGSIEEEKELAVKKSNCGLGAVMQAYESLLTNKMILDDMGGLTIQRIRRYTNPLLIHPDVITGFTGSLDYSKLDRKQIILSTLFTMDTLQKSYDQGHNDLVVDLRGTHLEEGNNFDVFMWYDLDEMLGKYNPFAKRKDSLHLQILGKGGDWVGHGSRHLNLIFLDDAEYACNEIKNSDVVFNSKTEFCAMRAKNSNLTFNEFAGEYSADSATFSTIVCNAEVSEEAFVGLRHCKVYLLGSPVADDVLRKAEDCTIYFKDASIEEKLTKNVRSGCTLIHQK